MVDLAKRAGSVMRVLGVASLARKGATCRGKRRSGAEGEQETVLYQSELVVGAIDGREDPTYVLEKSMFVVCLWLSRFQFCECTVMAHGRCSRFIESGKPTVTA